MNNLYQRYTEGISFSGDRKSDMANFFAAHNELSTYQHTLDVVNEAVRLAHLFNVEADLAAEAAMLHDISNVIPKTSMMQAAEDSGFDILEEEYSYHRIIHQKLSKDMAIHLFGCTEMTVLNAIECHTTLKAGSSLLDKVLFVADKISWDLPGEHPYQEEMREKIVQLQLNDAVLIYLNHV